MTKYKGVLINEVKEEELRTEFEAKNLCSALIVLAGKIATDYKNNDYTTAAVIDEKDEAFIDKPKYINPPLPTDEETEKWFEDNIGISNDCSASSAIFKFRLWLKERDKLSNI